MSVAVVLLFAVPAGVAVLTAVRRFLLYPARLSEWRYTFGSEHRDARRPLHEARKQRRNLLRTQWWAAWAVERHGKKTAKDRWKKVREMQEEQAALLYVPPGDCLGQIGTLRLYKHEVHFLEDDTEENGEPAVTSACQLAGFRVRVTPIGEQISVVVTRPNGTETRAKAWRGSYSDDEALDFEVNFNNAAAEDQRFREYLRRQADGLNTNLEHLKADADTAEREAKRNVFETIKAQRAHPQRKRVDNAWDEQCQIWQERTGRRPVWWWRW